MCLGDHRRHVVGGLRGKQVRSVDEKQDLCGPSLDTAAKVRRNDKSGARAPGIDGLETYKRIIQSKPNQKAIIASGYSETERVRALQSLGAGQYIKKPYTMEKIGMAVKAELQK